MVKVKDDSSSYYLLDEKAVKRFVRQMLRNHTFVGHFIEQRYVAEFGCYKKIIQISKTEDIFIEDLSIAKRKLERFFHGSKWIGITVPDTPGAPVGFNLWVEIEEQIFGTYKFLVKDVKFLDKQISLKLQLIETVNERPTSIPSSGYSTDQSNSQTLGNFDQSLMIEALETHTDSIICWSNLKEVTVFMFLLLAAIITGGGQVLMFLMDYTLKLLREFSNVLNVITPIIVSLFDTISKIFGYICFLVAMLWRDRHSPPKQPVFYPHKIQYQAAYPYEYRYKALCNTSRSSVTITELPD